MTPTVPAYALIDSSGVVVNLVDIPQSPADAPGKNTYVPPTGQTLVPTNGVTVLPGYTYAGGVFTAGVPAGQATADLENAVDAQRVKVLAAGYVDAAHTGKTWQCDDQSRGFLTAVGASAFSVLTVSPQPTFTMIPSDNSVVTMSAADVYALINGRIMPWVSNVVLYARSLKNEIEAGQTPASIETGWPTS